MTPRNKINAITIKDENSGEEFTVHTLRTAAEIAGIIEETEKEVYEEMEMEARSMGSSK